MTSIIIDISNDENQEVIQETTSIENNEVTKNPVKIKPSLKIKPKEKWRVLKINDTTIWNTNWKSYNVDSMNIKFLKPKTDYYYYNSWSYRQGNTIGEVSFSWDEVDRPNESIYQFNWRLERDKPSFYISSKVGIAYYGIIRIFLTENKDSLKIEKIKMIENRHYERYKSENKIFYFTKIAN